MRRVMVMLLVLLGSAARAQTGSWTDLVKTRKIYFVEDAVQGGIPVATSCAVTSFTPSSPAAVISPASNDPRRVTPAQSFVSPIGGCTFGDSDGDGYREVYLSIGADSLMDLGRRTVECEVLFVPQDYCTQSTAYPPCNWGCPSNAPKYLVKSGTNTFTTVNSAPTANISRTPASPAWNSLVTLKSNASDPDSGAVVHRWSVSKRPSGSTAQLVNASSATPTITFTSDKDIGTWEFKLEVDDNEGEMKTFLHSFTVPNVRPNFAPTGPTQVVVNKPIQLGVTNTRDTDGGDLTFTWDILAAPAGASQQPQNGFSTASSISVPTARADIGSWRFKVTGRDNEGDEQSHEVIVEVINAKPRIELSGPTQVPEGTALHLATAVTEDDDGGALQLKWEAIQAPASAGMSVPVTLSQSAALDLGAATAKAGTWVFRLTATDDEGESVQREARVLVDGQPVATIASTPASYRNGEGVLRIDGTASVDPDSPCPDQPMGCHLTAGQPVVLSPGLTYEWWVGSSVNDVPLSRASTVFRYDLDSNPVLSFLNTVLPDGQWDFELRVRDGEGNEARHMVSIDILPGFIPPEARVSAPVQRLEVDVNQRVALQDLWLDASQSRDADNGTRWNPAPIGAGITDYQWTAIPPSLACTPPVLPHSSAVALFRAGTVIPPECQGVWTVRLTVVDDDPAPRSASTDIQVAVGNCASRVCLDAPSTLFPATLYADQSGGPLIGFHIDSVFYDVPQVANGGFVRMALLPEGTSSVFYMQDIAAITQNGRGQLLFTTWDGRSNAGVRGAGRYDLVLSIFDGNGTLVASNAWPRVITVEAASARVASTSDTHLRLESVQQPAGAQATFKVDVSDALAALQELRWQVKNAAGTAVASGTVPGSSASQYTFTWNGKNGSGAVPVGAYTLRVDCVRNGVTITTTPAYTFYVYSLALDPVVALPSAPGISGWVHLEGSPSAAPVTAGNFATARLRMTPVRVKLGPAEAGGTLTLAVSDATSDARGNASSIELFEDAAGPIAVPRPKSWNVDGTTATGVRMLAYGNGPSGDALLKLAYTVGGRTLAEDTVRYQVARPSASAGLETLTAAPYFVPERTFNTGEPVRAGFDTRVYSERRGASARVYVVPHRTQAQWVADPSLVDVAGGPRLVTFGTPSGEVKATLLAASLPEGTYDLVYDFGNFSRDSGGFTHDGRLDPGDVLVSPQGAPAAVVKGSLVAAGPMPITTFEYGTPGSLPPTVTVPDGWDELNEGAPQPFRLRGRVTHPTDMSVSRPLVVFVHGNHTPLYVGQRSGGSSLVWVRVSGALTSEENYRGYTYLQDHLAKRGYVTLSVDLDEMSGAGKPYPDIESAGILLRAWVTLKNIEYLVNSASSLGTGSLSGRIDLSRIYLVGHSRGGEAVQVMLAQLKHLAGVMSNSRLVPPGGSLTAALQPSGIKGIVSLAPVTQQLDAWTYVAPDVPYLLLYGSADGDVNGAFPTVMPFRHYDRAARNRFALRLMGGNHNAFNTSWGYSDASERTGCMGVLPSCDVTNVVKMPLPEPVAPAPELVSAADQRTVATAYLTAFLSAVNDGDKGALEYFLEPPSQLRPTGVPSTLRLYSQSQLRTGVTLRLIDDYEFNLSPTVSGTGQPVAFTVTGTEERLLQDRDLASEAEVHNRFFNQTYGVLFSWATQAMYEFTMDPSNRSVSWARSLNLRVAQQPLRSGPGQSSFQVELEDAAGRRQAVSVRLREHVAPVSPAAIWSPRQQLPDGSANPAAQRYDTTSAAFQTYRLPMDAFDMSAVDLGNITKVRLRFGEAGEASSGTLALDDVEIEYP
ncbi:FlgD immunoglobulin-like domain containing protein [Pyxidicoccus parkwayensis]|nr:FlgD immunoglobulin-like domain containing protein [Pyxidicoccus parkwaysis]